MDCSLPDSSVLGILQVRILKWVTVSFSRGSSWPKDRTLVSSTAGGFSTLWTTRDLRLDSNTVRRWIEPNHLFHLPFPENRKYSWNVCYRRERFLREQFASGQPQLQRALIIWLTQFGWNSVDVKNVIGSLHLFEKRQWYPEPHTKVYQIDALPGSQNFMYSACNPVSPTGNIL